MDMMSLPYPRGLVVNLSVKTGVSEIIVLAKVLPQFAAKDQGRQHVVLEWWSLPKYFSFE